MSSCKIELQVDTQRTAKSLTVGCFAYGQAREPQPWLLELDGILYFKLEFLPGATLPPRFVVIVTWEQKLINESPQLN